MKHHSSGNSFMVPLGIVAVTGVLILTAYPDLVLGIWRVMAWIATAAAAVGTGIAWKKGKEVKKALDQADAERGRKRLEQMKKNRAEQEARIKAAKEKAAQQEAKRTEKLAKEKAAMVKQATTIWAERAAKALQQEKASRQILEQAKKMPIRTAAGQVAIEWGEAAILAKWTSQQIIAATDRPDVKTEAREEAREAIMEATRIRESGGIWTEKQGDALLEIKEKARAEARMQEERLDAVRDVMDKAEAGWNVALARATRAEKELNELVTHSDDVIRS